MITISHSAPHVQDCDLLHPQMSGSGISPDADTFEDRRGAW